MSEYIRLRELIYRKGSRHRNQLGMMGYLNLLVEEKNPYLLEYRIKHGFISQAVAAEKVGISRKMWMDLENYRINPTEQVAEKVAKAIGKPANEIFSKIRVNPRKRVLLRRISKLQFIRAKKQITQHDLAVQVQKRLEEEVPLSRIKRVISAIEWDMPIRKDNLPIVYAIRDVLGVQLADIVGRIDEERGENCEA